MKHKRLAGLIGVTMAMMAVSGCGLVDRYIVSQDNQAESLVVADVEIVESAKTDAETDAETAMETDVESVIETEIKAETDTENGADAEVLSELDIDADGGSAAAIVEDSEFLIVEPETEESGSEYYSVAQIKRKSQESETEEIQNNSEDTARGETQTVVWSESEKSETTAITNPEGSKEAEGETEAEPETEEAKSETETEPKTEEAKGETEAEPGTEEAKGETEAESDPETTAGETEAESETEKTEGETEAESDSEEPETAAERTEISAGTDGIAGQFELLQTLFPDAQSVGIIYSEENEDADSALAVCIELADSCGIRITAAMIEDAADIDLVAAELVGEVDAVFCIDDPVVNDLLQTVDAYADEVEIPVFGLSEEQVQNGCLAAYVDGTLYWNTQEAESFDLDYGALDASDVAECE